VVLLSPPIDYKKAFSPEVGGVMQRPIPLLFVLSLSALGTVPAHAAEVDKHARSLAATCAACHGTDGKSVGGTAVLAGMDKIEFIKQMKSFKSGQRKVTVMHQHAKGYTDAEIEQLATYFSAQKRGE
jgi:cytochrome subunit of sulfide dehydrogenase